MVHCCVLLCARHCAKSCGGTEFSYRDCQFNNRNTKVLSLIIEGSIKCYGATVKRVISPRDRSWGIRDELMY